MAKHKLGKNPEYRRYDEVIAASSKKKKIEVSEKQKMFSDTRRRVDELLESRRATDEGLM